MSRYHWDIYKVPPPVPRTGILKNDLKTTSLVLLGILLGLGMLFYVYWPFKDAKTVYSVSSPPAIVNNAPVATVKPGVAITLADTIKPSPSLPPSNFKWKEKQDALNMYVRKYPHVTWGISVNDVTTGENVIDYNARQAFTAASTTKLITAIAYLKIVEDGRAKLDEKIGLYPAAYQLQQLVQFSNNDSWDLFITSIGKQNLATFSQENGLKSYHPNNNTDTPSDLSLLISELAKGTILNADHTALLLSYMKNTEEERFLPAGAPKEAVLYHKTGLLEGNVHDVGIFTLDSQTIAISIFSEGWEPSQYSAAATAFHDIERIIFSL